MKIKNISALIATSIGLSGCCVEPAPRHSQPCPCPRVYSQPYMYQAPSHFHTMPSVPQYQQPMQSPNLIYQGPAKPAPPIPQYPSVPQYQQPTNPKQDYQGPSIPDPKLEVPEAPYIPSPQPEIIPTPQPEKLPFDGWKPKRPVSMKKDKKC